MNLSDWKIVDLEQGMCCGEYVYTFNLEYKGERYYHVGFFETSHFGETGRHQVYASTGRQAVRVIKRKLKQHLRREGAKARRQERANRKHRKIMAKRKQDPREVQL